MAIIIRLDVALSRRKMRSKELAEALGITPAQMSKLKNGYLVGMRFETLNQLCKLLDCQPGELLEYVPDEAPGS